VPKDAWNVLGVITKAFFLAPEADRSAPVFVHPDTTAEYGQYLATALANCRSCHTARNMKTGEYTGSFFAGGLEFRNGDHPETLLRSPNLTPDSASGRLAAWTVEEFISRFRAGQLMPWSPMPWGPYRRMADSDLRALYYFLKTLPATCFACRDDQEKSL
jgi:mono/diheme cytochrome c family protein